MYKELADVVINHMLNHVKEICNNSGFRTGLLSLHFIHSFSQMILLQEFQPELIQTIDLAIIQNGFLS